MSILSCSTKRLLDQQSEFAKKVIQTNISCATNGKMTRPNIELDRPSELGQAS